MCAPVLCGKYMHAHRHLPCSHTLADTHIPFAPVCPGRWAGREVAVKVIEHESATAVENEVRCTAMLGHSVCWEQWWYNPRWYIKVRCYLKHRNENGHFYVKSQSLSLCIHHPGGPTHPPTCPQHNSRCSELLLSHHISCGMAGASGWLLAWLA